VYLTPDHQGSTSLLFDGSGQSIGGYSYSPFGENPGGPGGQPYTYTGREDDGTGLMYYRARYYAPGWGRFISEDPIGFEGGINPYAYCGNNPLTFRDPSGLCKDCSIHPPVRPAKITDAVLQYNMAAARAHFGDLLWFHEHVRAGAPWDYKQLGSQYEAFGNFHFGAVAFAIGVPMEVALREAGRAQQASGTSKPEWGDPGTYLNELLILLGAGGSFFGELGWGAFGDDPVDQEWIRKGYGWAEHHFKQEPGLFWSWLAHWISPS
jgi:RHS repeat-associated protein